MLDAMGLEHPGRGEADRHQRRLGVLGQRQGLGRAVPDEARQLLAEGVIDLGENGAGFRIGVGERLAHADGLAPLSRKGQSRRHRA